MPRLRILFSIPSVSLMTPSLHQAPALAKPSPWIAAVLGKLTLTEACVLRALFLRYGSWESFSGALGGHLAQVGASVYEMLGGRIESLTDSDGAFLYTLKDASWITMSPRKGAWFFASSNDTMPRPVSPKMPLELYLMRDGFL